MNQKTSRIEYKQQLTNDLEKGSVAFPDYHEGDVMYIGIKQINK